MARNTQERDLKKKGKRKGVHSKTKTSYLKGSKNWKKPYRGQGR